MAKVEKITLKQLEVGQVYYLGDPVRVAKVTGTDTLEVSTREGVDKVEAFVVQVRLATKVIPGFISAEKAKTNKDLLEPPLASTGQDTWREWWGERKVHPIAIDRKHGGAAYRDDKRWEIELAVLMEAGRGARLTRTSAIKGKQVLAALVDSSCWPVEPKQPAPTQKSDQSKDAK